MALEPYSQHSLVTDDRWSHHNESVERLGILSGDTDTTGLRSLPFNRFQSQVMCHSHDGRLDISVRRKGRESQEKSECIPEL